MRLPKHTGTVVGIIAVTLELPMLWTLFIVHDSVSFLTALALLVPAPYLGIAGLVFAVKKRSRLGTFLSALSLGGMVFVLLVFWAVASALGQG
ncbi:MAG: hypothetical protein E6G45_13020 [Actinobacteria bacterium]|nr:MAG: hypothetical protein E6G45_13020 [Actinomycetota bacterium]